MTRAAALWAAGVALVVAALAAIRGRGPVPAAPTSRVALVGDSLAVGLAQPVRKLVQAGGGALVADGRTGTTIRQWAREPWLAAALATRPEVVLVSLGTNDMRASGDKTSDAREVARRVRESGALLVWLDPPAMPFGDPTGVRAAIRAAAPAESIFPSSEVEFERAPDRIHATPAGYSAWAGMIWDWYRGRGLPA